MRATVGIVIALVFSLLYAGLYPMLTGASVIYWSPHWPPLVALAYVTGGIVLQGWLCYRRGVSESWVSLGIQVLAGFGYLMVSMAVFGGPYQS